MAPSVLVLLVVQALAAAVSGAIAPMRQRSVPPVYLTYPLPMMTGKNQGYVKACRETVVEPYYNRVADQNLLV